jgi:exodeoxyribonuclease VII large subunit
MDEAPENAGARIILTPSRLNALVRELVEDAFPLVWLEGELSNCSRPASGHLYFTLKDSGAQVRCAMFRMKAMRLRFRPADGAHVLVRARVSLYEARGEFQLVVEHMEEGGEGALRREFERLKAKLHAEGLFDQAAKRALPRFPRRIGVLTSPSGAAVRDVLTVLARRNALVAVDVLPVPVQGAGAAAQIAAMLAAAARSGRYDVLLLTRGGGSLEDLWCWNDEALARAIAACPVPVISAIGHETDFTIADFVADRRAPTHSAAAEIAVPVLADLRAELAVLARRLARGAEARLTDGRLRLERARRVISDPRRFIAARRQDIDELGGRAHDAVAAGIAARRAGLRGLEGRLFRAHPQRRIADQRAALRTLERRLGASMNGALGPRRRAMAGLQGKLDALSPLRVLERGYSLARGPDGRLVTRARDLAPGESIVITLREGEAVAEVKTVREPSGGGVETVREPSGGGETS